MDAVLFATALALREAVPVESTAVMWDGVDGLLVRVWQMRSVNLHFHMGADEAGARVAREKLQRFPPGQRLGALTGTAPEVIDRIGEYIEVGTDGLNIAFRPPIDWDAVEAYIDKVLPVFH